MMWRNRRGPLRSPLHAKKLKSFKFKLWPLNLASFPKIYQETFRRRDVYVNIDVTMTTELASHVLQNLSF